MQISSAETERLQFSVKTIKQFGDSSCENTETHGNIKRA